ncbi:helix-turn-helix transcriptional regulator [Streptomyces sp. SCSIO 30461]|uniref:helix-turn-helix domain-containing protein n=1 Tax=Streptomyces sp. SCSIO 30461 TaxID=3118085 RepID=UPI00387E9F2B
MTTSARPAGLEGIEMQERPERARRRPAHGGAATPCRNGEADSRLSENAGAVAVAEGAPSSGDGPSAGVPAGSGPAVAVLSRAECRVVGLVAEGFTNRAVAACLFVTPSTVEQHLTRVYRKLAVRSRVELAALWRAADDGAGDGGAALRESGNRRAPAVGR